MYEVRDSAAVFLRRKGTDSFLFHLRDDIEGIADPGMWSLIGGGIDEGESPEQAVKREAREEIGLELSELRYLGTIDAVDEIGDERHPLRIALFIARIDVDAEDIDLSEGQQVRYFTLERVLVEDLKPEFKRFIMTRREDLGA